MGVCHSSKSTSSHSREGQKVSGDANNKENDSPNQGEQRREDAEGGNKKKNEPNTSRTPAVAINSDVFISRSDVNPELIYKKVKCLGTGHLVRFG